MPEDQSGDVDFILRDIARDISENEDIENLGKGLGFTVAECQNFIKTNYRHHEITNEGTVCMLRKWSTGVSPSSLRSDLREALKRARLVRIADIHLPLEIEESICFGDTIMGNLSDELEIEGLELDEYIRTNQQKVLILYDGLDEYAKEISKSASNDDATIAVIRGEKFKNVRVIVTTRPWKKERIKSDTKLEKQYTFVEIEGFKPDDVSYYISKFFPHNEEARNSLISLMTDSESIVAQNMAPYPIYCSMLCFIWQNEGNRSVIQGLETFANFFDELIHHLKVHFAGKETDEEAQETKLVRGDDCLQNFGKDALSNLLRNQLVFGDKDLTVSDVDVKTACEIGVLTREEHFVSRRENNKRRTKRLVEYRIPHKLFQEYMAGLHLAWLYENNPEEFNQLNNKLIEDFEKFSYLLYFTAAQGVDVGKAVLSSLCKMLPDEEKLEFIIDVAFECHRLDALQPLIPYLNEKKSLSIRGPYHTASGWVYAWEACGYFASECSEYPGLTEKDNSTAIAARNAGRGICLLSNLTSLDLTTIQLHEDFFTGMSSMASQSKLESISHGGGPDLSAAASQAYAKSICTMPNLKALRLFDVGIADNFFISLAESAPGARLESISHGEGPDISATAAQAYAKSICTMPNLQSLELHSIGFADDFFLTLAASASGARLQSIRLSRGIHMSSAASQAFAKSVCVMPNLKTLELDNVNVADDFFLALAASASGAKLQSISHTAGPGLLAAASNAYAKSICTMHNLQTLELKDVSIADDFFLALASSAEGAKLETIYHTKGPELSASASMAYAKSVCTMPNLQTLKLNDVSTANDFFVALNDSASGARLVSISHTKGPELSASASTTYAKSVCTMPNLQTLKLDDVGTTDDFFLALADSNSRAKLESISHIKGPALSASASMAYAKSVCTMPSLQTLMFENVSTADDFFIALADSASGSTLLSISHTKGPGISASASTAYAKSVCTMPNLQALNLVDVSLTDDFFLALADSASGARLESIRHNKGPELSTSASMAYAKSVCTMPNLQTLKLDYVGTTDDFYLTLADLASGAKLQSIKHTIGPDISPAASEAYAKSICTMPNLQTLKLQHVKLADDFFLALCISAAGSKSYPKTICTMPNLQTLHLYKVKIEDVFFFLALVTSAAGAKLQSIHHGGGPDISPAASEAYAKSICTMPNLQTLQLHRVKIADDFFLALCISAAGSKSYPKSICTMPNLQTLHLYKVKIADFFFLPLVTSAAGAKAYAKSICTMPNLQRLKLQYVKIADEYR
ncbi:LOW QUALITY PROTEIN: uncharacterized protein [Diadema setosum]|uniref:LOW QUALITY PROTEIN: uncharacterized protein n=1 Tax=Diadema setosum TaxID=31175 RepID=UPI003B3B9C47